MNESIFTSRTGTEIKRSLDLYLSAMGQISLSDNHGNSVSGRNLKCLGRPAVSMTDQQKYDLQAALRSFLEVSEVTRKYGQNTSNLMHGPLIWMCKATEHQGR